MISKSCIMYVKSVLKELNIDAFNVSLGAIETEKDLSCEEIIFLENELKKANLELCRKKEDRIVDKITNTIIEYVYNIENEEHVNISDLLTDELCYNYNYLSNIFLTEKSTTIQQFTIKMKIERAKELLLYEELSLTEIAYRLQYSSCAHLSGQFKKVTGLTSSEFIELHKNNKKRTGIQGIKSVPKMHVAG